MLGKYVVLRTFSDIDTHDVMGNRSMLLMGLPRKVPTETRIDVESLSQGQLQQMSRDPGVRAIAPVMPIRLVEPVALDGATVPVTEAACWGVSAVRADRSSCDGADVVVAVLDTGIDAAHPAFEGVKLVRKDFTGSSDNDTKGHGTHCAGTMFGRDVDGKRIGVARGVTTALIGKVLSDAGGQSDWLFDALTWALSNGARVISMSLGFDFPGYVKRLVEIEGYPIEAATSVALAAYRGNLRMFDALMGVVRARAGIDGGAVVVAAAGNESHRPAYAVGASLPAAADGVIAVAALELDVAQKLNVARFSNTLVNVSAPGVNILSAKYGGGLVSMNGTSMATPHVAGIIALWWQAVNQSQLPKVATTVTSKLLSSTCLDGFVPGVDVADRGMGLVTAPP